MHNHLLIAQQLSILIDVLIAIALGGVIGYERERADKPAGFRTQMLVAGGAALMVGLSSAMLKHFDSGTSLFRPGDPLRVIEAIITGISFLGAGTIFKRSNESQVEGLTTAASILMSAAVGIAAALQAYVVAIGATIMTLAILESARLFRAR